MTKLQFCGIALLFIATQAAVTFVMQQVVPHTMPPQWEYRIYYLEPHQSGAYYGSDLHALGEKGWELVSMNPERMEAYAGFAKWHIEPVEYRATFKRPRGE